MEQTLAPFLSFILLYKYAALFGAVFVSNIIFVLPSNILILVSGVFTGTGYLNFYWSLFFVVAANTLGDFLFYRLARRYPQIVDRRLKRQKFVALERLKKFMQSSAGPTIIIAHCGGAFTVVVSLLSGLAEIPWPKFICYAIIGNVLMDFILLYSGFVLGLNWEQASGIVNVVSIVITVVMVAVFGYKALAKNRKQAS